MAGYRLLDVSAEEYAVVARVSKTTETGERIPRSDRLAAAMLFASAAEARCGRETRVVESDDGDEVAAVIDLGDASEEAFEETTNRLSALLA